MSKCPICSSSVSTSPAERSVEEIFHCPRCGDYRLNVFAKDQLTNVLRSDSRKIANASGWVREHQNELITSETIGKLIALPTPSYGERKRKLLGFFQKYSKTLGQYLDLDPSTMIALEASTWCSDSHEVGFLLEGSEIDALIKKRPGSEWRLTAKGYDYLAQLDVNPASRIGFCAMWFDDSVRHLWDKAIEPAIGGSGYQPLRIDKKEHVNRIDDEIFADIRRSRFVVADFTHDEKGVRGGVYFEAGFAQGLGLPVIWTCRKDMLSEDKLHFDIRQYNFLEWSDDSLGDFKGRLQKRIEAILGRGTWKPNA